MFSVFGTPYLNGKNECCNKSFKNRNGFIQTKKKNYGLNLLIELNGKRLYETNSVKYLVIKIHDKRNWKAHIDDIALKLISTNLMLYVMQCIHYAYSLCMCYKGTELSVMKKSAL